MNIGRYEICGLLGRGGMGKVYKVKIPVIGKIAALKLLEPNPFLVSLMGMEKIGEMFVSEAVLMANLRHPHIADIRDFGEADGKLFYLMDYYFNNLGGMIGETYRSEIRSRVIAVEKAVCYTLQILEGLACLHYAGIVHRDIKPYNILITEQDTVKICDFGLSKLRGERFCGPSHLKVGTPCYAAPEQEADPNQADFSADIYSVGIMLYRMLTGMLPVQRPEAPSRINPDLDKNWDDFIGKATEPDSRRRFSQAKVMIEALNDLYALWKEKKEKMCSLPRISEKDTKKAPYKTVDLRFRCVKVNSKEARTLFSTDELWQPLHYIPNRFRLKETAAITDQTTGLVWQQSGSDYPLTWEQAYRYIRKLNEETFAGFGRWRLPTVDELMSLLTESPRAENFCMEPIFDQTQKWLWSCDRRSYTAAWYVSVDMGFVSWQDFSAHYYVRAVCRENK